MRGVCASEVGRKQHTKYISSCNIRYYVVISQDIAKRRISGLIIILTIVGCHSIVVAANAKLDIIVPAISLAISLAVLLQCVSACVERRECYSHVILKLQ